MIKPSDWAKHEIYNLGIHNLMKYGNADYSAVRGSSFSEIEQPPVKHERKGWFKGYSVANRE